MARTAKAGSIEGVPFVVEVVDASTLKPHPRNYKQHPEEQLRHIGEMLKEVGFFKNVVTAKDGTLLAGHGVVEAAKQVGLGHAVPIRRLDLEPNDPRALKVLAADNELGRFAESDDRALTMILKDILQNDPKGLVGTGYDEENLAALVMVTRPESEIRNFDAAAEWVGMPEFVSGAGDQFILTVQCQSAKDREEAAAKLGVKNVRVMKQDKIWTGWYPDRERNDLSSLEWKDQGGKKRSTRTGKKGTAA